jgi:hypothetical protein
MYARCAAGPTTYTRKEAKTVKVETMREKTFNVRLSVEEAERLDAVAKHYSLTAAAVLRMLVKQEHDRLELKKQAAGDDLEGLPKDVLEALPRSDNPRPFDAGAIQGRLCRNGYDIPSSRKNGGWIVGLKPALNWLREHGYIRRLASGYVLTDKGKTAIGRNESGARGA